MNLSLNFETVSYLTAHIKYDDFRRAKFKKGEIEQVVKISRLTEIFNFVD